MRLEKSTIHDSPAIAAIYRDAFPGSIRFFFAKKEPGRLLDMLNQAFNLVFLWGGQGVVAKDRDGSIRGYCLYSSPSSGGKRNWRRIVPTALRLFAYIAPLEALRLVANQLVMSITARKHKIDRSAAAHIISIAVCPTFQAGGLGTALFNRVLDNLRNEPVLLNVRLDNEAAGRVYRKAGFSVYGSRRDLQGRWLILHKDVQ